MSYVKNISLDMNKKIYIILHWLIQIYYTINKARKNMHFIYIHSKKNLIYKKLIYHFKR